MTTTLPDPATGTDAGTPGGVSTGLRAEADRLAALPRSWTPSIDELLEEEARHQVRTGEHATDKSDADEREDSRQTHAVAHRPTLADLDQVLDQLADNDTQIATLHARRAVLLAQATGLAEALESDLLDPEDPTARRSPSSRRLELARRAVTAEIATTLRIGEHATGTLTDHAVTLTSKAPATLTALHQGRLSWAHATAITTHLADLNPQEAATVERSVLAAVISPDDGPDATTSTVTCTPAQVARRARRARDTAHPVPADVRHTEATAQRAVWLDDGRDGMTWLVAHLPAPLAHAAYDRLTRTARHLVADDGKGNAGHGRTLAQARADTLTALLLDDGTLDSAAAPPSPGADTSTGPTPHGTTQDGDTGHVPRDTADDHRPAPAPDQAADQATLAILARSIRPQVTVTVPVLTLLGITDAPATMNGHVPIDPDTARHLTALAPSLRRILTHPENGTVLSVGRDSYTVPADLKALVRARDTTCRFPGCTHPATHTDLDHTTAWASGGTTSATNLATLCRRHHVTKHQTSWQLRQVNAAGGTRPHHQPHDWGGTLEWTSPTGRRHLTHPEPVDTTRHRTIPHTPEIPDPGPPF
ncbi:DUF222 domain-containing protein [Isoptericola sp. NPDC019482]|uniref:HNH endonuclease signature motif containing protein n=1 Tax=Isoptericola sp. NPDC019482 TaxID=3154688 RepID=UPI0034877F77